MNGIKNEKTNYIFKILFLGDSEVGKTSIILRFVNDIFKNSYTTTVGIDYKRKLIEYGTKIIQLNIFDTAGQERFKSLTRNYYKDSDGVIMVFDLKNYTSFEHLFSWIQDLKNQCDFKKIGIIVVGNKKDGDLNDRKINYNIALNFCNDYNIKYIETSALTNENINDCFDLLIKDIIEKKKINIDESPSNNKKNDKNLLTLDNNSNGNQNNKNNVLRNGKFCCL